MNILMLTNTYLPHVGGVARSVVAFSAEYRRRGHRVLVIAPEHKGAPEDPDVVRVPAIQNFNGSDFSVRLPVPGYLSSILSRFRPDIVHAHHPFLLGDTALRIAAQLGVPLVFTHHTMYEHYTHYVPGDCLALRRYVKEVSAGYANLCDQVFAPSESVAATLRRRGVVTPIEVVPTGVDVERFAVGDGRRIREELGIPPKAFVVGHVGRLAPEKNLPFLAQAVARFLRRFVQAHFLVVGSGPSDREIRRIFADSGPVDRLHFAGTRQGQDLADAYHAMDVFAFASHTETQGMVLTEAMAAGVPVVAIDAPGVREVVRNRRNGRLLRRQRARTFAGALAWVFRRTADQYEGLRHAARKTAASFSISHCAERALRVYKTLIGPDAVRKDARDELESTPWESALHLVETEWRLWVARARAVGTALQGRRRRLPLLGALARLWRRLRRTLSRSEWGIRLLGLSRCEGTAEQPGVLLVQIDGLSRYQFERALSRRRLPFLRRLMLKKGYRLHTVYSGLPSSTPAFQGEFFYGVRCAVPGFSFRAQHNGQAVRMFEHLPAAHVQQRLDGMGDGLLRAGSAYCDIYAGGAAESHFCPATWGWSSVWRAANPWKLALFSALHAYSLVRVATMMVAEAVLAVADCARGLIAGQHLGKELKFIPSRVAISILLRELLAIGAGIDTARGLPVIHLNFLGYDEQAHRRGPGSAFAHWSLKGIDRAIRRVWNAAQRSARRRYEVWIYSDHGQERTVPYPELTGKTVQQAVAEVFQMAYAPELPSAAPPRGGIQHERSQWLGGGRWQKLLRGRVGGNGRGMEAAAPPPLVTAMGPLGHIYPPRELDPAERERIAGRLVAEARIPMVLAADGPGKALAWTARGRYALPEQSAALLGADHPFLEDVAEDLVCLCHHPEAGALLISGWQREGRSVSFALENGAHAGPGFEETRGFALLPASAHPRPSDRDYLRPLDLRRAALERLGRVERPASPQSLSPRTGLLADGSSHAAAPPISSETK